jgi:transcriptional regulator with PAS, ATPase and Fis domain
MYKVLLIVPYPELEGLVEKIYRKAFKRNKFSLDIKVIRVEDIKKDDVMERYDVLIARGQSASLLKSMMPKKTVLEIPITGYDIMRAIIEAKEIYQSKKIGLFISNKTIHDEATLSKSFDMDIKTYIVPKAEDLHDNVVCAIEDGMDTLIGGYSSISEANQIGVNSIIIQTGEEGIYSVLYEAMELINTIAEEEKRNKTYQTILKESEEGIIYVNEERIIEIINRKGIQLLEAESNTIHNKSIDEVYPYLTDLLDRLIEKQHYIQNELINVGDMIISFSLAPVVVNKHLMGAVITCQSASKIQQLETEIRKKLSEKGLIAKYNFKDIIHTSEIIERTINKAMKFAMAESNILIVGETGTGKELMAQSIHNISSRNKGPFVAVNCAALPENLLESELFGYVEGAFTGSKKGGKLGLFEQANNGTIFLDEISELPINFQGKLLRVLQENQVRRVGDDRVINIDVRIIAATNRNLTDEVKSGNFRQDLLYRLDILRLFIPPLRDRREDIYPLFMFFLKNHTKKIGLDIVGCTAEAKKILDDYCFVGNIRELRNIAERISVIADADMIDTQAMKDALYPQDVGMVSTVAYEETLTSKDSTETVMMIKANSEKEQIIYALKQAGGKKSKAAMILGIDRTTLWRKMKNYNIL